MILSRDINWQEVVKSIDNIAKIDILRYGQIAKHCAMMTKYRAQEYVPIDTGDLHDSANVRHPAPYLWEVTFGGGEKNVEYAVTVHEVQMFDKNRGPIRRSKYLERAIDHLQAEGAYRWIQQIVLAGAGKMAGLHEFVENGGEFQENGIRTKLTELPPM